MEFKKSAVAEITAFIIGYLIIGIGLAFSGFGVWSLVFALLTKSAILGILTFLILNHKISLSFSWLSYKLLLSFGIEVSVINYMEFLEFTLNTIFLENTW